MSTVPRPHPKNYITPAQSPTGDDVKVILYGALALQALACNLTLMGDQLMCDVHVMWQPQCQRSVFHLCSHHHADNTTYNNTIVFIIAFPLFTDRYRNVPI